MVRPPSNAAAPAKRQNQPGRPTAAELARRKLRVIEVATDLFVKEGYAGTSLIDIARGAGVATRTLYQHFGDKEALFREVIFARNSADAIEKPQLQDGDTLFDALKRVADYATSVAYRPQSIGLMRLMIAESQRFPEFMKQVANSIFGRFRSNIEKVFLALEQADLIPQQDHALSAKLFADLIQGSYPLRAYTEWRTETPSDKEISERIELFILGRFGPDVAKTAHARKATLA